MLRGRADNAWQIGKQLGSSEFAASQSNPLDAASGASEMMTIRELILLIMGIGLGTCITLMVMIIIELQSQEWGE